MQQDTPRAVVHQDVLHAVLCCYHLHVRMVSADPHRAYGTAAPHSTYMLSPAATPRVHDAVDDALVLCTTQVQRALVEWVGDAYISSTLLWCIHPTYQGIHHVVGYTYTQWYHLLTQGVYCGCLSLWCVMTQISRRRDLLMT